MMVNAGWWLLVRVQKLCIMARHRQYWFKRMAVVIRIPSGRWPGCQQSPFSIDKEMSKDCWKFPAARFSYWQGTTAASFRSSAASHDLVMVNSGKLGNDEPRTKGGPKRFMMLPGLGFTGPRFIFDHQLAIFVNHTHSPLTIIDWKSPTITNPFLTINYPFIRPWPFGSPSFIHHQLSIIHPG